MKHWIFVESGAFRLKDVIGVRKFSDGSGCAFVVACDGNFPLTSVEYVDLWHMLDAAKAEDK